MENKNLIFFVKEGRGLTSTSANHIANMAKEMVRTTEQKLASLRFFSTEVALIGNDTRTLLSSGDGEESLNAVPEMISRIGHANSLIAWLREAIKAKESLINDIERLSIDDFVKLDGIELPKQPEKETSLTTDEYLASLSLNERNRYYCLEAMAAAIGKEIHPDGNFAKARNELTVKTDSPNSVEGDGRDTLIYSYSPSVDSTKVEDVYFKLQDQYRDVQSKLNLMKSEMERAITESKAKTASEYSRHLADWNSDMSLIRARHSEYIRRKVKEYSALKIAIPESLEDIYQVVSHLGKDTSRK